MSIAAMKMALETLCIGDNDVVPYDMKERTNKAIEALRQALESTQKLEWLPAPTKTEWGEMMVHTAIEIDNNHYFDIYCEEDQKRNVESIIAPTKKEWVGLTRDEIDYCFESCVVRRFNQDGLEEGYVDIYQAAKSIEAELKEKNT